MRYKLLSVDCSNVRSGRSVGTGNPIYLFFVYGAILVIIFLILCVSFLPDWPPMNHSFCVNGDSLQSPEQMWCVSNKTTNVTAETSHQCASFFLVKKSNLPKVSFWNKSVEEKQNIDIHDYTYLSFALMPGSSIKGKVKSSTANNMCYLLNYEAFSKFTEKKKFRPLNGMSIKENKGSLDLSFNVVDADTYYVVVHNDGSGNEKATFSLDITYAIYETDSLKPFNCSDDSEC